MPSAASTASVTRPSREESLPSPARSSRVKIMPCRPRAERLCSIWRASVVFPQSIVPEKNTSSGMGGRDLSVRDGRWQAGGATRSGAYFEQRDELLGGGHRAVHADHRGLLAARCSEAMISDVVAGGRDHVADPAVHPLVDLSGPNQPAAIASSRRGHPELLAEHLAPARSARRPAAPGTA